ncbi:MULTISPECIES: ribbon-helix-helix protein, CopG family [Roseomonas]|uniref:ribbon-helix-helix protein, CopG family n=1 Tax=Roseomonas TaxID=125216 RepID=UPI00096A817F|nr:MULTISPECIES: ribbon-helix-helix protein, CopG family [Roseomonas]MCG7351399.1 ribbon-helix-helix domain-containing protein [Roseomonas mucosa]
MARDGKGGTDAAGRKQFLVHIDADVIRRVKILALDRGVSASSLVETAIADFLARSADARPQD